MKVSKEQITQISKKINPLISVITVVFNGEKYLEQAIKSTVEQTYENFEYLVIDGGSTDGTQRIIQEYSERIDYWISEKDKGIYDAMNKGVTLAKGRWVIFINADDYFFDKDVLKGLARRLECASQEVAMLYGSIQLVSTSEVNLGFVETSLGQAKKEILYRMAIPHQSLFTRLSVVRELGGFKTDYKIAADYELCLRVLHRYDVEHIANTPVACMRVAGVSSNPKNALRLLAEYRRARIENDLNRFSVMACLIYTRVVLRVVIFALFGDRNARGILDVLNRLLGKNNQWKNRN